MAFRLNVSIPPLTRGLILGLVATTLLNAGARYRLWYPEKSAPIDSRVYYAPYLTIIPGTSILYPWVFITATLAEQNILGLLTTGATVFYGGRYLERAWSSREFSKFIFLVALVPNISAFALYYILFIFTRHEGLITTAISGGIAIQAAFLVSFKQLVPEHTVSLFRGIIRMRVKHFPALFLLANTISGILFGTDTAMLLAWFGFFVAWVYLRFFRVSPSLFSTSTAIEAVSGISNSNTDSIKGDASDTFAFAAFSPDVVQPAVATVSDFIYTILVSLRLCTPFSAADVNAGNEQASARGGGSELPSLLNAGRGANARSEAERRRAIALRALDQRLNTHTNQARQQPAKMPAPSATSTEAEQSQALQVDGNDDTLRPKAVEEATDF